MKSLTFVLPIAICLTACSKGEAPAAEAPSSSPAPITAKIELPAGAYTLDKAHASLTFRVNHLGFSHYTARFKSFDAQLQFEPNNLAASSVTATVDPKSLDLDNPPAGFLDELLGPQFFDAKQFPIMTFKSTKLESLGTDKVRITGDFSFHGVTKPVTLDATFNGGYTGHPMDPHARIGFSATGSLKRGDFGVAYGIPAPGTTMGVSDAVQITIEAEFSGPPSSGSAALETK